MNLHSIQNFCPQQNLNLVNSKNSNRTDFKNIYLQNKSSVSFQGHMGVEEYAKDGIKHLIHESGFLRDIQTKEFVKDYITKNFAGKDSKKIVVGGCSTAEEAYCYKMLLDNLGDKLKIMGFDLSSKVVETAKSGKILMQRCKSKTKNDWLVPHLYSSMNDSFLCYDDEIMKQGKNAEYKKVFDKFFEISQEKPPEEKRSLIQRIKFWFLNQYLNFQPQVFESKYVILKPEKAGQIEFLQGDIMKLNDVTKGEKADVITFSNAIYHLICDEISNLIRVPKKNAEEIVGNIVQQVKQNLNPNGIFVRGEHEILQTFETDIVKKAFEKAGFRPLNSTDEHMANVWQLI